MTQFGEQLSYYLAKELNVKQEKVSEVLTNIFFKRDSLDTNIFFNDNKRQQASYSKPDNKPDKKSSSTSNSAKINIGTKTDSPSDKHTCERIKRGNTKPCGKNARRYIEHSDGKTRWYCGGEKSGCYAVTLNNLSKNNLDQQKAPQPSKKSTTTKNKTNAQRKESSKQESGNLLRKIMLSKELNIVGKDLSDGRRVYVDKNHDVLFNKNTHEAYGVLDENENILDIDDTTKRWLEASNIPIYTEEDESESSDDELEMEDDFEDDSSEGQEETLEDDSEDEEEDEEDEELSED